MLTGNSKLTQAGHWRLRRLAAEFGDGGIEHQYRIAEETHQRRLMVTMCLIVLVLYGIETIVFYLQNAEVSPWMTALRTANATVAVIMLIAGRRRAGYGVMDNGMLLLALLIVFQSLLLQARADPDELALLARNLGIIALGHILLPTRFLNAMLVVNTLMVVALIQTLGILNLNPADRVAFSALVVVVNCAGMATRWLHECDRRRGFALSAELASARQEAVAANQAKSSILAALRHEFALPELVEEVAELLAPEAAEKGLELTTFVDPALPDRVLGDAARLRQILLNLTGNAIKFTEQGAIGIGVSGRPIGTDMRFEFRVVDTGIGLTAEQREKLFQPLQQADGSMAPRYGESGLGLNICRHLVEMMGGSIAVDSSPGQGSTFFFGLILEAAAEQPPAAPDLAPARLLLAAETTPTSDGVALYLAHAGVRVSRVGSAAEALALLQGAAEGHFAAALIDHQLPDTDGLALGRSLLADARLAGCKPILLAPFDQRSLHTAAEKAGFFASLTTPLRRDLLWQTVAAALAGTPPLQIKRKSG